MSLYENWAQMAYTKEGSAEPTLWDEYLPLEQKIYEELLTNKITKIEGTLLELSKRYNMSLEFVCGFLDGINEVIKEPQDINQLTEESDVCVEFEFESLYRKMIEYKAEHLYSLPEWSNVLSDQRRKELFTLQRKSGTVVKAPEPGRNEPCSCGSGKKYKKCCGA